MRVYCRASAPAIRRTTRGAEALVEVLDHADLDGWRRWDVKVRIANASPQASSPCVRAISASFSTSSTRRPSTQASVESETSTRTQTGEVAGEGATARVDPVGADAAGAPVGDRADQRVEVELVAVGLAA